MCNRLYRALTFCLGTRADERVTGLHARGEDPRQHACAGTLVRGEHATASRKRGGIRCRGTRALPAASAWQGTAETSQEFFFFSFSFFSFSSFFTSLSSLNFHPYLKNLLHHCQCNTKSKVVR